MEEPELTADVVDLSGVSLAAVATAIATIPLILLIQVYDLLLAIFKRIMMIIENRKPIDPRRKSGCLFRILRTIIKLFMKIK